MESILLFRDEVTPGYIRGSLFAKGEEYQILERPWINNRPNISCIPADIYTAAFLPRSGSGKYKNVYQLLSVIGRSGILTHNGNIVTQSHGCLIIGKRRGRLAGQAAVLNSVTALYEFVELMEQQAFSITIIGNQIL
jgi:hypothetical protein